MIYFTGNDTDVRIMFVIGGGHCPMDQVPDTVNNEILRFLSQVIEASKFH